ncbi:unnamed protein product [Cunninghamella blakesleeana]
MIWSWWILKIYLYIKRLCINIKYDSDLKDIRYLWIDTISVDQQNKEKKKEIILKMNEIDQNIVYNIAMSDLHWGYLMKNTSNMKILDLINDKYKKKTIYKNIFNGKHSPIDGSVNNGTKSSIPNSTHQQQSNNDEQYSFIQ